MKSSKLSSIFSRLVIFPLLLSLAGVQTMIASTAPARGVGAAEITVTGRADAGEKPFVLVNGEQAFSGRTFFSNGTVATTETSTATLRLGGLGRIEVAPSSSLVLSFSQGQIVGTLSKGNISVSNMNGVSVKINTPDDSVTNDGSSPSRFTVSVLGERTGVAVESGSVLHRDGAKIGSKDDDDDDKDHDEKAWWIWGTVALVAGAVILVVVLNDDDDEIVSPVR